ncbi:DUF3299 domain-containing protein [Comamonadaceae bacterium G21597-S1]|nr:DUF3299 domain-containing protein [Comamonadaceae bacterium G21597-S1]
MRTSLNILGVFACIAALGGATQWLARDFESDQATSRAQARPQFREIAWQELVPPGWDPLAQYRDQDITQMDDGSAEAVALARRMRETWDNAPTNRALDGARVRLSGYVVPLESDQGRMSEFLLVPFFGACIHVPAPAANQMVHVRLAEPVADLRTMDLVWVNGQLTTGRTDSAMGMAGYRMLATDLQRRHLLPR